MIISSIRVKNFLALREFSLSFHPQTQCLIGYNGTGKTTLLRLLAGIAGIDDATRLVAGAPIGGVELTIQDDRKTKTFAITDKLDEHAINKFKKTLSRRVSFPVTTWDTSFVSECCPQATDGKRLRSALRAISGEDIRDNLVFTTTNEPTKLLLGDGFKQLISLISLDSPDGVPMLVDTPEVHLSITSQRFALRHLERAERQLIYATHSIQMMPQNSSDRAICELTQDVALDV